MDNRIHFLISLKIIWMILFIRKIVCMFLCNLKSVIKYIAKFALCYCLFFWEIQLQQKASENSFFLPKSSSIFDQNHNWLYYANFCIELTQMQFDRFTNIIIFNGGQKKDYLNCSCRRSTCATKTFWSF
jgi:hypothetical protein